MKVAFLMQKCPTEFNQCGFMEDESNYFGKHGCFCTEYYQSSVNCSDKPFSDHVTTAHNWYWIKHVNMPCHKIWSARLLLKEHLKISLLMSLQPFQITLDFQEKEIRWGGEGGGRGKEKERKREEWREGGKEKERKRARHRGSHFEKIHSVEKEKHSQICMLAWDAGLTNGFNWDTFNSSNHKA